jgi:putative aldouronate transport system substrate-binding protein
MRKTVKKASAVALTAAMAMSGMSLVPAVAADDVTTIKVMLWDRGDAPTGGTIEENEMSTWINEQIADLGIQVEFVAVPRSGSDDKLNVMMSGGQAPDIVFTYDQNIFLNYASLGGLADLTEAYETIGTNIQEYTGELQDMGVYDGTQYALVSKRGAENPRHTAYIRQDILDELGMEMPTTKEELFDFLYAVKDNYPDMIPWGMSGRTDTEKMYLNFVGSYVTLEDDKDAYVYSEAYLVMHDGALDGIRKLNELYNDGIISQDFATDTDESVYKTNVAAGKVAFFLDDNTTRWGEIETLDADLGTTTFVPVSCFTQEDGSIRNIFEQMYGMWIMIPATSQKKVDACITYLNWLADPENAENVAFTPEHEDDENGVPQAFSSEELIAKGYKSTLDDYNILNKHFTYTETEDGLVASWLATYTFETEDWFRNFYETIQVGKYRYPVFAETVEAENEYGTVVKNAMLEYVYRLISCSPDEFDSLQEELYSDLLNSGLQDILDQRAEYYDEMTAE